MSEPAAFEGFVDKWRQRWPEWGVLSAFVPSAQRSTAAAWFTLLQELHEAAWGGSDSTPGLAKLAWWQEELRGWARGARRHPLGEVLQKLPAPWAELGIALPVLPSIREQDDAGPRLDGYARCLLACETVLFDGMAQAPGDVDAVTMQLRGERALLQGDRLAAQGLVLPMTAGSRPRRLQQVALQSRLQGFVAGRQGGRVPALRLLLQGWRAARQR